MATCDLEKQQLRKANENKPSIIYHISNNSLPSQKIQAPVIKKNRYSKHIRCQPVWFSILFLTFLALTMILATASVSTSRILDYGNIPYQRLRKISQGLSLKHLSCEDSDNEQGEDFPERSLVRSTSLGKHLLDMVKRASSNDTRGTMDASSASKPLPSTIDPTTITSTSISQSVTLSTSTHSTPISDYTTSGSSPVIPTDHTTSSESSATTTSHQETSHSSTPTTHHSKSSASSSKSHGGNPTGTTSAPKSDPSHASSTSSVDNGLPTDSPGDYSSQTDVIDPTSSVGDVNSGNQTSPTGKHSAGAGDISPTTTGNETPHSSESSNSKKGGHKDSTTAHDASTTPVKSQVTRKTYFTTTLADGAVTTLTSTAIIMASSTPTGSSGDDKLKGSNGLQTSKASQIPNLSLGQVLLMSGVLVMALI